MKRRAKRRKPETVKAGNVLVKIYRRHKTIKTKAKDGTITKRKYTVFQVEDYTSGKRTFRDTTDHDKAVKMAERIADQLSSGQAEAAAMSNAEAASYGRSVELARPLGISLEACVSIVAKCHKILSEGQPAPVDPELAIEASRFFVRHRADKVTPKKVADVVAELIEVRRQRTKKGKPASARYLGDLSARLERFAKDFGVDIGSVTTADVQQWLDKLSAAPQTVKNFRTILGTLFAFAETRGYIFKGGNPVEGVEHISANGGAIEIYSPKEVAELLKAASKDFLPIVALGAFAGLRTAEIQRLDWKDIDVAGGFIHIAAEQAKTKSRRLVPILPNLALWLADYAKAKGLVWKGNENDLRDARAATVESAKTPWKDNGLRHSFISYRLADVQNAAQVALEAGNSAAVVFRHYRELVKPDAAREWFAVAPETGKDGQ